MRTKSARLAVVAGLVIILMSIGLGLMAAHRVRDKVAPPDPHPPLVLMRRA